MTKHLRSSVVAFAALTIVLAGCNSDDATEDTTELETDAEEGVEELEQGVEEGAEEVEEGAEEMEEETDGEG